MTTCPTCKRKLVDPMTLNSAGYDRSMCYKDATGSDVYCRKPLKRTYRYTVRTYTQYLKNKLRYYHDQLMDVGRMGSALSPDQLEYNQLQYIKYSDELNNYRRNKIKTVVIYADYLSKRG